MNALLQIILGIAAGFLVIMVIKSFKMPGPRKIQAIMFFGKFFTLIANVEGKRILKPGETKDNHEAWDLVDLESNGKERRINVYFFPWPFFTTYRYPITFTKAKKIGQEKDGDVVIWKDEITRGCIVSRSNVSDHVEFRVDYPTITPSLDTAELATVHIFTNNVLEAVNAKKMLFGISNYLGAATELINGILKGLVSGKNLEKLNEFSSNEKEKGKFDKAMQAINKKVEGRFCLPDAGMELVRSVYKDFEPADDKTRRLMESYSNVIVAEQEGKAALERQKGVTEAFLMRTNAEIAQDKKKRIETGRAKTDTGKPDGNISELIPEADVKVIAENIGKLSETKGTVVLDSGINKMLKINTTKDNEGGNE